MFSYILFFPQFLSVFFEILKVKHKLIRLEHDDNSHRFMKHASGAMLFMY